MGVASDDGDDVKRGGGSGDADKDAAVEQALRNERERRPPGHEITGTKKPEAGKKKRRGKAQSQGGMQRGAAPGGGR